MKLIMRFISGIVLVFAAVMLFSCNLEDFNLHKLSKTNEITPDFFAPFAYGTFKVSDLAPTPAPPDNVPIPTIGIDLDPVIISKVGTSFSSAAIDSVYLITHFTNDTPCEMEFELSFVTASGIQVGKSFPSGRIEVGAKDLRIPLFDLGPVDQYNLEQATDIKLSFKLFPPTTGNISYGAVKSKQFSVKISFYAPVDLQKL